MTAFEEYQLKQRLLELAQDEIARRFALIELQPQGKVRAYHSIAYYWQLRAEGYGGPQYEELARLFWEAKHRAERLAREFEQTLRTQALA